jgi:hypothetical protein
LIYQSRHLGKRSRSGHRHGITDAQRRELPQYWAKAPVDAKPTQNQIATWFSAKFHPISQSTVSDSLKPIYDYLDTEKRLERPERLARKDGNWPDLEAALFQWQLATNRQNNTLTGHLLQEMAKRFWLRTPQYRDLPVPKFSAGWLDAFKTRYHIRRRIRHGEAGKVDTMQSCSRISLRVTRSPKRRSLTMIWTRLSQFGLPRLLLPYRLLRIGKSSRTTVPSRSSSSSRTLRSALGRCSC